MDRKTMPVFLLAALFIFMLNSTASAQEGTLDPNTPISSVNGVMTVLKVSANKTISEPFGGSGRLAPESAQYADAESQAGFVLPVASPNPETVINKDDRTQVTATTVFPNAAIAYLIVVWPDNTGGICTGWFIGPRTVATAAHCVYNIVSGTAHGWAKSVKVYAGRNGARIPYKTSSYQVFAPAGWMPNGDPAYDYGAIQTIAATGNTVGYFGYTWQASDTFPGFYAVRGYPGDKPAATMWTMSGPITHVNASRLWYEMDTYAGQSGSPLFKYVNGKYYGYGIHTYAVSEPPYFGNSATRITQSVFNNFETWKAVAYP